MTKQTIFISYSHKDESYKNFLLSQLFTIAKKNNYEIWQDRKIETGTYWNKEIFMALERSCMTVLLISKYFLNSNFIQQTEFPKIKELHENNKLIIYPIIIQPCLWNEDLWIKNIQVQPLNGKPLSTFEEAKREEVIVEIVKDIQDCLKKQALRQESKPSANLTQPIMLTENSQISQYQSSIDSQNSDKYIPHKKRLTKDWIFYDINRTLIIKKMIDLLIYYQTTQKSPIVAWIFHGVDNQCLNKFIKRQIDQTIHKYLKKNKLIDSIDWPQDLDDPQPFEEKIASNIAWNINRPFSEWKFKSVVKNLNDYQGPVVLKFSIYSEQWKYRCKNEAQFEQHCKDQIQGFIDFIRKWPNRNHGPLIAMLLINYIENELMQPRKGLLNRLFKKKQTYNHYLRKTLDDIKGKSYDDVVVFDELEPILYSDAMTANDSWIL